MFSLIRKGKWREIFTDEGPALLVSLAVSEMFFKFHSFLLESVAFLALWYVLGAVLWTARKRLYGGK